MNSKFEVFVDDVKNDCEDGNKLDVERKVYLRSISYIFGSEQLTTFAHMQDYKKRSLDKIEELRAAWLNMKPFESRIVDLIRGFACMVKKILDKNFLRLSVRYCIDTKSKYPRTDDTNICSLFATDWEVAEKTPGEKLTPLTVTIRIKNVTNMKQLLESLLHDIAHGIAALNMPPTRSDINTMPIGDFDEKHTLKWCQACVFLVDAFGRVPIAASLMNVSKEIGVDVRSQLDATLKVRFLNKIIKKTQYLNVCFKYINLVSLI